MESQLTLSCPLCQEEYDMATKAPILMPCQHTVCESCVLRLIISEESTGEVTESDPIYENTNAGATTANASLNALANVIRQHPPLRKVGSYDQPLQGNFLDSRDRLFLRRSVPLADENSAGDSASLSAGASVPRRVVGAKPRGEKAAIPEEKIIRCPVCRIAINTSRLQTNRYVVDHMRAVGRLGNTPPAPPSRFLPKNFWCEDCSSLARGVCRGHTLRPLQKWVEDVRANKKDALSTLSERLRGHSTQVDHLESIVKTALHALTKASRKLWSDRQALQELEKSLEALQENGSPGKTLELQAISLRKEMETLSQAEKLMPDVADGAKGKEEVALRTQGDSLLITTRNPDRTVLVNISEGGAGPPYV